MATTSCTKLLVPILLLAILLTLGLVFEFMGQLLGGLIKSQFQLATNKHVQRLWAKPPIKVRTAYWLYDIENPDQFLAGAKLRVRKVGPFNFYSTIEKRVINLSDNKYRVTYNATRFLYWDQRDFMAPYQANLDEQLTIGNLIFAALNTGSRELTAKMGDETMRKMAVATIDKLAAKHNESLLVRLSARDALFGRQVPLLRKLAKLAETMGDSAPRDARLPELPPNGLFGFASIGNGTWTGPFEVYTGYERSAPSLGDIISFDGKRRQSTYSGRCNRLQASAGELRPMPLHDNQTLEMFRPEVCRILHLKQRSRVHTPAGLAYKYQFSSSDFASANTNPDNRCYCYNSTVPPFENYCSLEGVLELGPCASHAPIAIHFPTVTKLDSKITETIDNWTPELIEPSLIDLPEPSPQSEYALLVLKRLGVPMKIDVTVSAFIKLRRDTSKKQFAELPELTFIPAFMVRDIGEIPPQFARIIVALESFIELSARLRIVMYITAILLLVWLASSRYSQLTSNSKLLDYGENFDRGKPGEEDNSGGSVICRTRRSTNRHSSGANESGSFTKKSSHLSIRIGSAIETPNVPDNRKTSEATTVVVPIAAAAAAAATTIVQDEVQNLDLSEAEKEAIGDDEANPGKHWLAQVYSNFLRAFVSLRSPLSKNKRQVSSDGKKGNNTSVEQINAPADDDPDKRLEELANKIASWGNTATSLDEDTLSAYAGANTTNESAAADEEVTVTSNSNDFEETKRNESEDSNKDKGAAVAVAGAEAKFGAAGQQQQDAISENLPTKEQANRLGNERLSRMLDQATSVDSDFLRRVEQTSPQVGVEEAPEVESSEVGGQDEPENEGVTTAKQQQQQQPPLQQLQEFQQQQQQQLATQLQQQVDAGDIEAAVAAALANDTRTEVRGSRLNNIANQSNGISASSRQAQFSQQFKSQHQQRAQSPVVARKPIAGAV